MEIIFGIAGLLLGALGILIPLGWDYRKSRQEAKEAAEEQKRIKQTRERQLLQVLRDTLQKNLELVQQMIDELKVQVIFYNADTQLLDATASLKYDLINDLELNRQIDTVRYELQHLNRKVDLQLDLWRASRDVLSSQEPGARERVVGSIYAHITKRILGDIQAAIRRIDDKLKAS